MGILYIQPKSWGLLAYAGTFILGNLTITYFFYQKVILEVKNFISELLEVIKSENKGHFYGDYKLIEFQEIAKAIEAFLSIHHLSLQKIDDDKERAITMGKKFEEESFKALKASKSKEEFLAKMSHEIRTPMAGVLGMTEMLLDTDLNEEQKEIVSNISYSGELLLSIINNILDFSKFEAGKMVLDQTSFSLQRCLENSSLLFIKNCEEKNINIETHVTGNVPKFIMSDSSKIRQVIVNLLGNAVKFTEKGTIYINCNIKDEKDGEKECHISIKDSGIGLSKSQIKKLFTAFEQADSSISRQYGGTGLGLVICKHICEFLGGRIWVESEEGQGATFHFTFRAKESIAPAKEKESKKEAHLSIDFPLKILVAEDN